MTLISVIVPVYNMEKYLSEAIESILAQTYDHMEIIVVDDGSTDRSGAIAESYLPDVRIVRQNNQGITSSRNAGIRSAAGEYFAFLDSDDIWVKNKLERQMEIFAKEPTTDLVYGYVRQFFSPEISELLKQEVKIPEEVLPAHLSSSMLVKREAFFRVGLYEPKWKSGIDLDWHMRAVDIGLHMVMLPEIVFWRRIHQSNYGRVMKQFDIDRLYILKAAIDRRRNMGRIKTDG